MNDLWGGTCSYSKRDGRSPYIEFLVEVFHSVLNHGLYVEKSDSCITVVKEGLLPLAPFKRAPMLLLLRS